MVIKHAATLPKPIKWYSVSRCCRYERPQRGRFREFFQWNIDILGVKEQTADAEVIAAAVESLREMGLRPDDIQVRIGSRRLFSALLSSLGVADERQPQVFTTIDRMTKMPPQKGRLLLSSLNLGKTAEEKILQAISAQGSHEVRTLARQSDELKRAAAEAEELFALLGHYGIADFCVLDLGVVRMLAYYTGLVFEVFAKRPKLRAVAGGGRYDDLISTFGGQPMPAVGFGLGDAVVKELLSEKGLLPEFPPSVQFFAVPLSEEELPTVLKIVQALRLKDRIVEYSLSSGSVKKLMREAASSGAQWTIIVGPDELKDGAVTLRDMESGQQRKVPLDAAIRGELGS